MHPAEDQVEREPDDTEQDEVDEDLRRLQEARELEDAVAETFVRGDELGHDQIRPRPAVAEAERVEDALGSVIALSFWELPSLIELAEKAKLSSFRLRVQYEILLARPLLCAAMVLLAATVSLRSFRQGGIQTMVVAGMVGGIGFFLLTEVSRQIGLAGLVSAAVAVWTPVLIACLTAITVLLHQEDG